MSTSGSRETRAVTKGAQGFTFEEAQLKKAAHKVHDGAFEVEQSDGEHGAASDQDQSDCTGSDRTEWSINPAVAADAARALSEMGLRVPTGQSTRPHRRSLDKPKNVTTPQSKTAEVSAGVEAILSMMTPDDQMLYKGFKEMQQAALREGSHDRAKRFEQRMAALEDKTWGPVSSSAAASSSGSSSGDSASNTSMAAALAASVDAQAVVMAAHAAEKKLLEGLQKALDKIAGSAAVKANEGVITLLTRPERVTAYFVELVMKFAAVVPKGLFFVECMRQGLSFEFPLLSADSATKVSEASAEVARSLAVEHCVVEAGSLSRNPYISHLQQQRMKVTQVIKACSYLTAIDTHVRQILLSMLAAGWHTRTTVPLSGTTVETVTRILAALGYDDTKVYGGAVRRIMSSPKYLEPVGSFPLCDLMKQFKELYRYRVEQLEQLRISPFLYQFELLSRSLPEAEEGSALKNELNNVQAALSAFLHSPTGTTADHVLDFLDEMVQKYENRPYPGRFLPAASDRQQSAFLGVEGRGPWESAKKSRSKAPETADGKAPGKKQHPEKEARPKEQEQTRGLSSGANGSKSSAKKSVAKKVDLSESEDEEPGDETGGEQSDSSGSVAPPPRTGNGSPKPKLPSCRYGLRCTSAKEGTCRFYHRPRELDYLQGRIERCNDGISCKQYCTESGCAKFHSRAEEAAFALTWPPSNQPKLGSSKVRTAFDPFINT